MSFDIDFLVPTDREVPSSNELMETVKSLSQEVEIAEGGARGALWHAEYVNPETLTSFVFTCRAPNESVINFCARETGLSVSVPNPAATFIAKESMPMIVDFARKNKFFLYTAGGRMFEEPDPSQLQILWTESCRRIISRLSITGAEVPAYFPAEQLEAMWKYAIARPQLSKRYDGRGIYVPRVVLIRNKLARTQVMRSIFWADMGPPVFPEVDAVVISRPGKLIFGRFPAGESEHVVVRLSLIEELLKPCIRDASRPFEHKLIEDASSVRIPVFKKLLESLPGKYRNFETVNPDEVMDIKI